MQRDLDLIRKILFVIEAKPDDSPRRVLVADWDAASIDEHILQLVEMGFLPATTHRSNDAIGWCYQPSRLTAQGHDYLAAVRNDTIWKRTKDALVAVGGNAVLSVVQAYAVAETKRVLNLPV